MFKMISPSRLVLAASSLALAAAFAAAPVGVEITKGSLALVGAKAFARNGADDGAGHVSGGHGADDGASHATTARGSDNRPGDNGGAARGRGRDDGARHR
ncbi:hypothetical protein LB518_21450 [Mesorhizobium sp. BR1-1-16]|uniref:hypothetical protein n=1 Tax=Mesorhizobium sp. BR1-1-16 TaxID=2876653 RepID=UPI001CCEEBD9|nr:hypothetical protein [Mesorhizobium sp. BR1-1-16]MBZ9938876.1 hypothetical protein [Mesorhizobium sp. BR1-1-16]